MKKNIQAEADGQTERMQMRMSKEFLRRLDNWRRQQPDIPSRSESVRRLVEVAFAAGQEPAEPAPIAKAPRPPKSKAHEPLR